jgi:hypothetical protein
LIPQANQPQPVAADVRRRMDRARERIRTRDLWSAPAARSDDGALAFGQPSATRVKAVSRCACHRTPKSLAANLNLFSIRLVVQ